MISPVRPSLCRLVAFVLAASVPLGASGQGNGGQPAEERGWGSVWAQPANEQQRQLTESFKQYEAAKRARNRPAELAVCNRVLQKNPDQATWYILRAGTFAELQQFDRAAAQLDRAQALAQKKNLPSLTASVLLARSRVHQSTGNYPAAKADLESAVKTDAHSVLAWNNFAWLRATAPDAAVRDGRESVRLAQKAAALQREATYIVTDTLAAAYAEAGDYPRAVDREQRALASAAKEIHDPGLARDFQEKATERLHLFEQHQPYHAAPGAN